MRLKKINELIPPGLLALLSNMLFLSACAIHAPEGYDMSRGYDQFLDDEVALIHAELTKFESINPTDCNAYNLLQAESYIDQLENQILNENIPSDIEFDWNKAIASAALDTADSALSKGCLSRAENIYKHVIRKYTGFGFSGYTNRAMAGLNDIYSRR